MATIKTRKSDIIWNYIGTIMSMASGFLLLPFLLAFLNDSEVGLWYVFVAVANLTLLFEFGFNPAFARNIVYCLSGARKLAKQGCATSSIAPGVDWHLLNAVMRASKLLYAAIALLALLCCLTIGSAYIATIMGDISRFEYWAAWGVFCLAIFLNLYFYYTLTFLRGFGDIANENRAKTFARVIQLAVTAALLFLGYGLIGAAIGYLCNSVALRLLALLYLRKHAEIRSGLRNDSRKVTRAEIRSVFSSISFVAWRDGVVQLSCYASTQAMSIIASLFLDLAATGTYSILLQLGTAVYHFASAYAKSFYPAFQSARMEGNKEDQCRIVEKGLSAYWLLFLFGSLGVIVVVFPILPLFKPGIDLDVPLFLFLLAYLGLWNQHSICCNFIISMNEVPYVKGYLVAAVLGVGFSVAFVHLLDMGAWGLVLGQFASQIAYNNWKWPRYLAGKLHMGFGSVLKNGFAFWFHLLGNRIRRER